MVFDLNKIKYILMIGASANKDRDSYKVFRYFIDKGYKVIPVNPKYKEIDGIKCYNSMESIPREILKKIEMIDLFRRGEVVYEIIKRIISLKSEFKSLKIIWMQHGAYNEDGEKLAKNNGYEVVSHACAMVEHKSTNKYII